MISMILLFVTLLASLPLVSLLEIVEYSRLTAYQIQQTVILDELFEELVLSVSSPPNKSNRWQSTTALGNVELIIANQDNRSILTIHLQAPWGLVTRTYVSPVLKE